MSLAADLVERRGRPQFAQPIHLRDGIVEEPSDQAVEPIGGEHRPQFVRRAFVDQGQRGGGEVATWSLKDAPGLDESHLATFSISDAGRKGLVK